MRTIRRLYFYLVALVSLEVIVWGAVGLARTILNNRVVGLPTGQIATSLSALLVGLPVFLLHWIPIQRQALGDLEERAARLRALFLYGAAFATLIPVVWSILALVNRLLLIIFSQPTFAAQVGGNQSWSDNLVAIAINAAAAAYLLNVLRGDWAANPPENALLETRRLFRFAWLVFGLGLAIFGAHEVLYFIFSATQGIGLGNRTDAINGIALLLVGVPVWVRSWQILQNARQLPEERFSLLRLVVLFVIALVSVAAVLSSAWAVLAELLRWILGESHTMVGFINRIATPLSAAIPMGTLWAYYGDQLGLEVRTYTDPIRQAGIRRLYAYILSGAGLTTLTAGLFWLLSFIAAMLAADPWGEGLRGQLANAIALLAVGFPLWWLNWRAVQAEAARSDDLGDHARRSIVRKIYLYLALFAFVIAVMASGGQLIYLLVNGLLGSQPPDFLRRVVSSIFWLAMFAVWLAYHIQILRSDGRATARSLADRQAGFPVLVLDAGDGSFGQDLAQTLRAQAPAIPVAVQVLSQGIPGEEMYAAGLVVMPSSVAVHPSEPLRTWLSGYPGQHLIVPTAEERWSFASPLSARPHDQVLQAAQAVRQLAEGQPARVAAPASAWVVVGYVAMGLFVLELALVVLTIFIG